MLPNMSNLSEDDEAIKLIYEWNLHFVYNSIWKDFSRNHFDITSLDFFKVLLDKPIRKNQGNKLRVSLVMLMQKLADGQDVAVRYCIDRDATPLEEAVSDLQAMLQYFPDLKDRAAEVIVLMKEQSVFVCCRCGRFDLAKEVYHRNKTDDKIRSKEIEAAIVSGDPGHRLLINAMSYDVFMEQVIEFLHEVHRSFDKCFLIEAARKYLIEREKRKKEFNEKVPNIILSAKRLPLILSKLTGKASQRGGSCCLPPDDRNKFLQNLEKIRQDGSIKVDRKNNDVVLNREAEGLSNAGSSDDDSQVIIRRKYRSMSPSVASNNSGSTDETRSYTDTESAAKTRASRAQRRSKPCTLHPDSSNIETDGYTDTETTAKSNSSRTQPRRNRSNNHRNSSNSETDSYTDTETTAKSNSSRTQPQRNRSNNHRNSSNSETNSYTDTETAAKPSSSNKQPRKTRHQSGSHKRLRSQHSSVERADSSSSNKHRTKASLKRSQSWWRDGERIAWSSDEDNQDAQSTMSTRHRKYKRKELPVCQQRVGWTYKEEVDLYKGVQKYGVGNWAVIKKDPTFHFTSRTSVNLKDKWRNLEKAGRLKELQELIPDDK